LTIGLIVADLARSIAFYERLGLRFPESRDANGTAMSQRRFAAESVFTLDTEEFHSVVRSGLDGARRRAPDDDRLPV
jgi:catechol 2,3-dioxygenase-like lactoylglutathione lyase family enzyme